MIIIILFCWSVDSLSPRRRARGMSSSLPNVIRGREKSHRKKIAAPLSRPLLTSFGCPFGRLFSISFVFSSIPFADQHPDAYPNGLTIPIEPYPIRAPMARGRKGISRHGIRPLSPFLSFEPTYTSSLKDPFSLPSSFFYCKSRYSPFRGLLPRTIVFLSVTLIVGNVY